MLSFSQILWHELAFKSYKHSQALDYQVKIQFELSALRTIWKFIKAVNSALYHTDMPGNDMYIGTVLNTVQFNLCWARCYFSVLFPNYRMCNGSYI